MSQINVLLYVYFIAHLRLADLDFLNSLAYAEINLALVELFSRFDFDLYETSVKDVACATDAFVPAPVKSS